MTQEDKGREGWPAEMEDVFHRVSFIVSELDEDEQWVCRADALSIADVNAMVRFMRAVRGRALERGNGA